MYLATQIGASGQVKGVFHECPGNRSQVTPVVTFSGKHFTCFTAH